MYSENKNEIGSNGDTGSVRKITQAAVPRVKEITAIACGAIEMTQELLAAEVAHITRDKSELHGCTITVPRVGDGTTAFVVRVLRGGEIRIKSRLEFLPEVQAIGLRN